MSAAEYRVPVLRSSRSRDERNPGANAGSLVRQRHGGYLRRGNPGNRGGKGAPPSRVRMAALLAFEERLPALAAIADGVTHIRLRTRCPACGYVPTGANGRAAEILLERPVRVADRIEALKALGTLGLRETRGVSREELVDRLTEQARVITRTLPAPLARQLLDALRVVWA